MQLNFGSSQIFIFFFLSKILKKNQFYFYVLQYCFAFFIIFLASLSIVKELKQQTKIMIFLK